ncbi:hypothetical protein REH65_14825 [Saccharopolyspora sp. ID03-671]|uniref:hypothetical protein n=1 Tax=Saccharopolyspora sp. ID03-671 TaxID=3073066 RepID=UPI00324A3D4B
MSDLNVSPEILHRLANDMRTSTTALDEAATRSVSETNAGESTPQVQIAIAALARAAAGLLDGTKRTADQVEAGKADYMTTDDSAADNMPSVDGGN